MLCGWQPVSSSPLGQWGIPSQRCPASMQPPGGGQENWPARQLRGLLVVGEGCVPVCEEWSHWVRMISIFIFGLCELQHPWEDKQEVNKSKRLMKSSPQYISSDPSPQLLTPSQTTPSGPAGTQRPFSHWNSFSLQPPTGETGEGGVGVVNQR